MIRDRKDLDTVGHDITTRHFARLCRKSSGDSRVEADQGKTRASVNDSGRELREKMMHRTNQRGSAAKMDSAGRGVREGGWVREKEKIGGQEVESGRLSKWPLDRHDTTRELNRVEHSDTTSICSSKNPMTVWSSERDNHIY